MLFSALNLLFNLMKFYEKYADEYFIPQEIRKYFSIFFFQKNAFQENNRNWEADYNYSNIMLTNDKIITLPGALLHLVVSELPPSTSEQSHFAHSILKTALKIISCLVMQNK